jgi:two-component system response regulator FixJ
MSAPCVFVVDDDAGMRESLRFLLEGQGMAIETFASAGDFLASGATRKSGCAIVDVRMPGMTGLELQQRLSRENSPLVVVLMTGHADVPMAVQAMRAGAADFIEKPFSDELLLDSIQRAIDESERKAISKTNAAEITGKLKVLTPREREILGHLVLGRPHKVIGHELNISPRTVEVHRSRIMQKLGARNHAHLIRMMITAGPAATSR